MRLLKFALAFLISSQAHAISCDLAALMSHPSVANNASFWQEMGELGDHMSDTNLRNLYLKYGVDSPAVERRVVERTTAATSAPRFTLSKQAIKESRDLRPSLKKNLDEFLSYAKEGAGTLQTELRKNAGKWNYKKLSGQLHDDYSVRLDGGYRVVFKQTEEGQIEVLSINNSATH